MYSGIDKGMRFRPVKDFDFDWFADSTITLMPISMLDFHFEFLILKIILIYNQ